MKKIKLSAVILSMLLLLTACTGSGQAASGSQSEEAGSQENVQQTEASSQTESKSADAGSGKKALVAYFAYSDNTGTGEKAELDAVSSASMDEDSAGQLGNLQVMVQEAANLKNADIFSIQITEPYDAVYDKMVGVAQEDQRNNKEFTFVSDIENFDDYDVFYIGVPVWWGKLPQPMISFFEKYDFSGKTIVPFGIHLGSRFGSMIDQIKEMEPGADVKDGFTISADTDNAKVRTDFDAFLGTVE